MEQSAKCLDRPGERSDRLMMSDIIGGIGKVLEKGTWHSASEMLYFVSTKVLGCDDLSKIFSNCANKIYF